MLVHKFGGTSIGNADRIAAVTEIIAATHAETATVVVASAMSGTTNRLIAAARAAASGEAEAAQAALSWIEETHDTAATHLLVGEELLHVRQRIEELLGRAERILDSIAVLGELTARSHDAVACFGEQLSCAIMAATLRCRGIEAVAIHSTELIVTNNRFGSADPRMAETEKQVRRRILPLIEDGVIPIITGYIGATEDGIPTTLGRSGSDFSAAIIAGCLECDELRIWTDVDGILTADPNVVPNARVLRELSYAEATRLARFGAEVLHPRTMGPIIEKAIPLSIVNSFNPGDAGTCIVESPSTMRDLWPTIVSATGLQLLRLQNEEGPWQLRSATAALSQLDDAGIIVQMFSQSFSEQGINLVVSQPDAEHSVRLLSRDTGVSSTSGASRYTLNTIEQVATVSVIGLTNRGFGDSSSQACTPGIASRTFAALGKYGVRVVAVAQEATEDSVTFCIPAEDAAEAVRFLHSELGLETDRE